jgi:predicted TIM-barrel fold metal-dependent hydrolase
LKNTRDSRGLQFIDADGHLLEPPEEMQEFAPKEYRDRIWHIETDAAGDEWVVFDGDRHPANTSAISGTAGMSVEDRARAQRGEFRYTEIRPSAFDAKASYADLMSDGIDQSVLYPTSLLQIARVKDVDFAAAQCQTYNDWVSEHLSEVQGKLFGVAIVAQQSIDRTVAEIQRVTGKPGIVGIMLRPNPTVDGKHLNDPVYDPIWRAACDAGLPVGFHPLGVGDIQGACTGLNLNRVWKSDTPPRPGAGFDNVVFTNAIANPIDMQYAVAFMTMGGVCERFPELKIVFLEANGGWIVPWLERLDHNYRTYGWDAPWLKLEPSDYFRRQCWISFDPDESTLVFTANSPMVGAERIVWASDYPHPDAKFPGITDELIESIEPLTPDQRALIASGTSRTLYGI